MSRNEGGGDGAPVDGAVELVDEEVLVGSGPTEPGSVVQRQSSFVARVSAGVMTDPRSIAEYEQAAPGYGAKILDRFFDQTERNLQHRMMLEERQQRDEAEATKAIIRQGDRAQKTAFVVALAGFGLVAYIVSRGYPGYAAAFGCVELTGLVSVFIFGRWKGEREAPSDARNAPDVAAKSLPPSSDDARPTDPSGRSTPNL